MALHQRNLWIVTSHAGSSLDSKDSLGGLTSGAITLPKEFITARGLRVYTTSKPDVPEDYGSLTALITAIGGSQVTGHNHRRAIIEFNTGSSTTGSRGIFRIDGLFNREYHYQDPLTKGEAMRFMMPHGLDEYNWTGSQAINAGSDVDMTGLVAYSTDIVQGVTTIQGGSLIALPAAPTNRGLLTTVVVKGTFAGNGPHDFRLQARDAAGEVIQSIPRYNLSNEVENVAASFPLFTNGVSDELSTTGYKLAFYNDSQSAFTLKAVQIVVQSVSNPDFTQV